MKELIARAQKAAPANLWLITGTALVLIPHLAYQKIAIVVCGLTLLLWRLLYEFRYVSLPPKWLRIVMAFSAFAAVGALYHTIFGRNAGVALLLVMLCLKLLEMKTRRDFVVTVCLGYFVVITGFLYSQSILVAVYMFLAILVLTTAFITYHRLNATFWQPATMRLAGVMLLQALPLALLLFVLFPRMQGALWGLPEDAFDAKTGLSDSMSPGRISRLSGNDSVAFRVQFNDQIPEPSRLYWRGPVLTQFDGETWEGRKNMGVPGGRRPRPPSLLLTGDANYQYNIILEPHNKNWLFALDMPTDIPPHSYLSPEYELRAARPVNKLMRYEARSHTQYHLQADSLVNRHLYLQLPSNIGIRAQRLIIQLITNLSGRERRDEKVVQAVLNYFRQQPFVYTKEPPLLSVDPIDEFLFITRKGFCEHYASAFTFLMRAAGIPARVVTGYQGGELNTLGDYVIVRQSDAHAWSEVWLQGKGWVRIDPTSVIPPQRVEDTEHLERFRATLATSTLDTGWLKNAWREIKFGMDNINHYWNLWVLGYNNKRQFSFLSWLGLDGVGWQGIIILLFVGLFLIFSFFAVQLLLLTKKTRDPAQRLYQRFCKKMKRSGLEKFPNEGARAFAQRAARKRPDLAEAIERVTLIYNSIRYSRHQHSVNELRDAVNGFKP
jgi:transglutaminase-like putative cysteine protease